MEHQSRDGPAAARLRRLYTHLRHHFIASWPKALLVTAVATILDMQLKWLEPLQQAVFVVIANYVALHGSNPTPERPRVEVVEIDEPAFAQVYNSESPLSRCRLFEQLHAIYEAEPNVVAVDLDLSAADVQPGAVPTGTPACAVGTECEVECEAKLYEEIRRATQEGISTVLLAPQGEAARKGLRSALSLRPPGRILVADGRLPVTNGFTLGYFRTAQSFTEVVRTLSEETRDRYDDELPSSVHLDPRAYRDGVNPLPISKYLLPQAHLASLTDTIKSDFIEHRDSTRVVFFGGAYGRDDLFVSAVGPVYGVEAHAAAYMTDRVTPGRICEFVFDLLLAFTFGLFIDRFWERYFRDFDGPDAHYRYTAGWRILGFTAVVLLAGAGISLATLLCFDWRDLWISPLSLAATMLFDSFIGGLLTAGREACVIGQRVALRLTEAHCRAAGVDLPVALISIEAAPTQPKPPERFWANLHWRAIGDLRARLKTAAPHRTVAAGIADRLLWLTLVSFALWLLLQSSE